jgi:hypothetical protein
VGEGIAALVFPQLEGADTTVADDARKRLGDLFAASSDFLVES